MVVHVPGVALEALGVVHGLHLSLDRLILNLSISLAEPVTVGVDTLLAGLTVLPDLIAFRHPGQTQPVRQNLLNERLVRQATNAQDR